MLFGRFRERLKDRMEELHKRTQRLPIPPGEQAYLNNYYIDLHRLIRRDLDELERGVLETVGKGAERGE